MILLNCPKRLVASQRRCSTGTRKNDRVQRALRGFTLVELLVVITIIGILISLLLPAVQAAPRSLRRLQCSNNLKQLSLGMLNHEATYGWLPTDGSSGWQVGDPDKGFGKDQPGGWFYNTLPYIEQQAIHDQGAGKSSAEKMTIWTQVVTMPLAIANCPSRRAPAVYGLGQYTSVNNWANINGPPTLTGLAKIDYAVNAGNNPVVETLWTAKDNGISYWQSMVTMASIRDGTSNTYMVGEKCLDPDAYENGLDAGDDNGMYCGHDWDIARYTYCDPNNPSSGYLPHQDTSGWGGEHAVFGSAHAAGFNMAFCDGSVRSISYSIDPIVHSGLGNRADGLPIDGSKF